MIPIPAQHIQFLPQQIVMLAETKQLNVVEKNKKFIEYFKCHFMKSTKIILSIVAFIVTSASGMALRAAEKFNNRHQLFTDTNNFCNQVTCFTEPTGSPIFNPCDPTMTYFTKSTCHETSVWQGSTTLSD